jgi:hypothetical protein
MKTRWERRQVEDIDIKCPICGHQTAPPTYPYCHHTLFVFLDPSAGDAGFDFMTPDFAEAWRKVATKEPTQAAIASLSLCESCHVFEDVDVASYYPTRVIVGYVA